MHFNHLLDRFVIMNKLQLIKIFPVERVLNK